MVFPINKIFSQIPFEGKLVYTEKISNGITMQGRTTEYYKGNNVVCDMPLAHTKMIYRGDLGEIISINNMMVNPILSKDKVMRASDTTVFVYEDGEEIIKGFHCVKFTSKIENKMMQGISTIWIDTSFKILYEYGRYAHLPFGLVVKTSSKFQLNSTEVQSERELQEIVYGDVDPNIFALPDENNMIVVTKDEEGNIVLRESDSARIEKVLESIKYKSLEKIDNESFEVKTQVGYVLLDFSANWCGPCRMMAPNLDKALRSFKKSIKAFSVDIDECPAIAKKYKVSSVPTIVMLKDGTEIARFVGGLFSDKEISNWIEKNVEAR